MPTNNTLPVNTNTRTKFSNYLATVNELSDENKAQLLNDGTITTLNALKNAVNKQITGRKNAKKAAMKLQVTEFLSNVTNLSQNQKNNLIRKYNANQLTLNGVKNEVTKIMNAKVMNTKIQNKASLIKFLNEETTLNAIDKNALIREYNAGTNSTQIQNKARALTEQRSGERITKMKTELNAYMKNKNIPNAERQSFANSITKNTNIAEVKRAINTYVNASAGQKRELKRQDLNGHLKTLGLLTNEERSAIMARFNTNKNANVTALKNNATKIQTNKTAANREKLVVALNATTLNQNQKNSFLQKFSNGTSTLNVIQTEVAELIKKKNAENAEAIRRNIMNFINGTANLTPNNRNKFKKEFSAGETNANTIKQKVEDLIKARVTEQRNKNRSDVVEFMAGLDLSNANKDEIMNIFAQQFNAQAAKNAAKTRSNARRTEKFETNKANLRGHANRLGINGASVFDDFNSGAINLQSAKNRLNQLANKITTEKRAANRKALENYMGTLTLENSEKSKILKNFNNQAGNLNTLMKTAKNFHNAALERQRALERQKVKNKLNSMNLTNIDKKNLMQQFNEGARNINNKASALIESRKTEKIAKMVEKMREHTTYLGLSNEDTKYIINKITSPNANMNTIRNEATGLKKKRELETRAKNRTELESYANSLGLNKNDKDVILNRFNSTNASLNTLRKNANDISKARKSERFGQLEGHIAQLGLPNNVKTNLMSKLNSKTVKVANLMAEATTISIRLKEERREKERAELNTYVKSLNLANEDKAYVMKLFDDNDAPNVENIKKSGRELVETRKTEKNTAIKAKFKEYVNAMPLNQTNKNTLMTNFNANVNKNMEAWSKKANMRLAERKMEWKAKDRNELNKLMNNLSLPANVKMSILKNFDNGAMKLNNLKNRSQSEANRIKNEAKAAKRAELSNYLEQITNITQANRNAFLQRYNNAPNTFNTIKTNAKNASNAAKTAKREKNLANAKKHMNEIGLNNSNKNALVQSFANTNVSLANMIARANGVLKNRVVEKRAEFSKFLTNLNLTNANRNTILKQFDENSRNIPSLEQRARNLVNQRKSEKRTANRNALSNHVRTLKLNQANKNAIMAEFNSTMIELNAMKSKANAIVEQRRTEFLNAKKQELNAFTNELQLTGDDKSSIMAKFNNTNGNINALKNEARTLSNRRKLEKVAANRAEFTGLLNTLNLTNNQKTDLLKKFNSGTNTLNSLKQAATNMNTNTKEKAKTRSELQTFLNTLNINNATKNGLIQKVINGSATLNAVKNEATQMNAVRQAERLNAKKTELRNFMSNKNLTNTERNAFIARVTNKNMNLVPIKQEITNANAASKKTKQESANRASKLNAYLNTLNLTNDDKKTFKNRLLANNTNASLNTIKNEATSINTQRKKNQANRIRQEERLAIEQHLANLTHLTGPDMEKYLSNFDNGASLQNMKNASSKNNDQKAKAKEALKKKIQGTAALSNEQKTQFITQINKPHTNIAPINALIANAVEKKVQRTKNTANKLQALTNLERNNRKQFMNRLNKGNNVNVIMANATKLNAERKTVKAREQAKVNLQAFMENKNLSNTNKTSFLNRLNDEGANVETIKREIVELNKVEKQKKSEIAQFDAFLNTLDLNGNEKTEFKNKLAMQNTTINAVKAEASVRSNEKKLEKHLLGLKHLSSQNMSKFMNRLKTNTNAYNAIVTESSNMNVAMRGVRENVKKMLNQTTFNQAQKASYIKQLNKNHSNVQPLKNLIEKNISNAQEKKAQIIKNASNKIQAMTNLQNNNRKEFMNRLNKGNNINKIVANAGARANNRKRDADLKKLEERIPNTIDPKKKQYILDEYQRGVSENAITAMIDDAALDKFRTPLRQKIVEKIPGSFGIFRRGWEGLVTSAKTKEELDTLEKLLDEKVALREQIEASNIPDKEKQGHIKWIMQYKNDITKRREEFNGQVKAKKNAANQLKKNTATKLQALNALEKANRVAFMNRINKGENSKTVVANATKMNTNRKAAKAKANANAKAKANANAKAKANANAKAAEKAKQDKLRSNTAKILQNMKSLERANRKAFMNRLEKGEDPAKVIANAQKKEFSFGNTSKPAITMAQRFNNNGNAKPVGMNKNNAKRQIQSLRRMGAKNQNKYIKRINSGENATTVLAEAKKANSKIPVSKTKKNLEYNRVVKNVVRRL